MSLQRVVARVHETLAHLAESKGVGLSVSIDPALPAQVLGDALRLRQVLLNLVGNAVKFSSGEGHIGTVGLKVELPEMGDRHCTVEFVVEDDGIGMDAATLAELFQPFTQADVSTTRRFGGTGLGLSISSRIATLMGGRIQVASTLGRGSRFSLRVPFEWVLPAAAAGGAADTFLDSEGGADDDGERPTMPTPLSALGADAAGRLVLVAEDNETNQAVIGKQLDLMGFVTHMASTGREALELWRRGAYALLLTDLHMPVMDGFELAAAIRAEELPDVRLPIVALTADAAKSEIKHCRDVGMDDHMTKPLQLTDLHAMLRKWMPASAQPRPLRPTTAGPRSSRATAGKAAPARPLPAVDLAVLGDLVGSDPVVIERMLASFQHSAARACDAIRLGVSSGQCNLVADAAHSLKSAARSIGAQRLAGGCEAMEASCAAGPHAELDAQLLRFEQDFADVQRFLDARRAP
jgi:CheY-like chemotaxis protein/HPt (histidine-containing phosphotransfer) domain-containing protein